VEDEGGSGLSKVTLAVGEEGRVVLGRLDPQAHVLPAPALLSNLPATTRLSVVEEPLAAAWRAWAQLLPTIKYPTKSLNYQSQSRNFTHFPISESQDSFVNSHSEPFPFSRTCWKNQCHFKMEKNILNPNKISRFSECVRKALRWC
jgi:hypothetical protein